MDPYRLNAMMNKADYGAMKAKGNQLNGLYDIPSGYGMPDPNFMGNNLPLQNPLGFGDPMENMLPPNDQNMNYYQEYCRLFIANVVLTTQMKELIAEKNELLTRLSELEKGSVKESRERSPADFNTDKKVRLRRKAADIERNFICPVMTCQKSYGTEGSLFQHVRLKHPEVTNNPEWKLSIQKTEGDEQ